MIITSFCSPTCCVYSVPASMTMAHRLEHDATQLRQAVGGGHDSMAQQQEAAGSCPLRCHATTYPALSS